MSLEKAYNFIVDRVGGQARMGNDPLAYWRARILTALIITGLFIGFLGFIPLTVVVLKEGLWRLALFDVGFWLTGIVLLTAPRIRYEVRAGIVLLLVYLLGLHVIINVGPMSGGPFLIFAFSVLTGVLLGTKPAMTALFINAVTFAFIGWMMTSGISDQQIPFNKSRELVIMTGVTILLANAMATISLSVLVHGLVTTSRKERSLTKDLEIERSQLQSAKETLEKEIEERRSIEAALRESEKKYRHFFNNLPIGIGITDMEGRLIECNDAILKPGLYNRSDVENIGTIEELYYDPDEPARILDALGAQGILDDFPVRLKKKDSTFYHALLSLRPITIKGQACWHAMVKDVSERKKAELALLKSETRFKDLVQRTFDIIFETDDAGIIKSVTPQTESVFGIPPEKMIGKPFIEFVHPTASERVMHVFMEGLQGKDLGTVQVLGRKVDDSPVNLELRYILLMEDEKVTGTFGVIRDVTERTQLEEQLQQAQKMEAIGTLAGGIAHSFNNLLMGIRGRNSLVMTGMDPHSPSHENLVRVEEHVNSAATLVQQLLGFARGGKYDVKTLNLHRLIQQRLDRFKEEHPEITTQGNLTDSLYPVEADRKQMEQVFLNIFAHAGDAMPAGGNLFVEADNQTIENPESMAYHLKSGLYVKISITDTGVGMEQEVQNRIFDPFFTIHEMGYGTGLGLASAYGIVLNHGGTIMVDSRKDRGTTYTILLPASDPPSDETATKVEAPPKGVKTVLLVDDEEMIIDVGSQMLKALGYETIAASNGEEAIQTYTDNMGRIDVIVLDMVMPGMGGGDTFKALKAVDSEVNVLLSSGYSIDGQTTEILDMGCRGFIQKPFNMKELSEKLSTVL